jgi:uncharacterized protein with HEPN domain
MKECLLFSKDKTRKDLDKERMLVLSLIKEIEIIGEAVSKVTDNFKHGHPDIPWADIIGMRNRLIHGYFEVNLDILWNTIKKDIPALLKQVNKILNNN